MDKPYKKSREMGRAKPKPEEEESPTLTEKEVDSILEINDTRVENLEVDGDVYFLNGYCGKAENCVVIKSDFSEQVTKLESVVGKKMVGFIMLADGTVMSLMESL